MTERWNIMIKIEFEPPTESVCECCGNTTVRLTRFVYQDGDAHAVYYAQFTKGHRQKRVSGLIGLGDWGDGATPEGRVAFPFQIWMTKGNFNVGLVDAADSPWSNVTFLGRILNRAEALKHAWISDVFHITDHMVSDDKEVMRYFEAQGA